MTRTSEKSSNSLHAVVLLLVFFFVIEPAYGQQGTKTLVVTGHSGEATVIQRDGRNYVDLDMLAQMINGALGYQGKRIVLTLSSRSKADTASAASHAPSRAPEATSSEAGAADTRFSRPFVNAAIETLGSMREWGSTLALTIKSGYPVGNAMAEYRGRATKSFGLANAAASNDADKNGLQLLTNELNNLQTWSNNLVQARNSGNAANYTLSQDALLNDPLSQKILRCFQFLGPMFASGRFEDDGSCR